MKAKFKKIMASLLSAMMVFTMCIATSVQAAEQNGTLTITSNEALDGRTFKIYKLFNLTTNGKEDKKTKFSYTEYKQEHTNAVKTILEDNSFNEKKLTDVESIVEALGKLDAQQLQTFAKSISKNKGLIEEQTLTPQGNSVSVTLPYGYYVIAETTTYQETDKNKPTISLAMLKTVYKTTDEIKVKSELPDVKKELVESPSKNRKGSDYTVGDIVKFKVTGTAPRTEVMNTYQTYQYTFTDTLSEGLQLRTESIVVKMNNKDINIGFTKNINKNSFTIIFEDLKVVDGLNPDTNKSKNIITVEYEAKLTSEALVENPEQNSVHIEYSNNPDSDSIGKSEEDIVYVYNFGLDITKVDGTSKEALKGAEFVLEDETGKVLVATGRDGSYVASGFDSTKDSATVLYVDEHGKLFVDGLADGKYCLIEKKAPDGYNLLKDPIEITITSTYEQNGKLSSHTSTLGTDSNNDGRFEFNVENNSGLELPSTGGMGTTILYIAGILAMAGGVCYFVMDKKKRLQK